MSNNNNTEFYVNFLAVANLLNAGLPIITSLVKSVNDAIVNTRSDLQRLRESEQDEQRKAALEAAASRFEGKVDEWNRIVAELDAKHA